MEPGVYDFTVYQGATFTRTFVWTTDGDPVDLTGRTARMQIRPSFGSSEVYLDATTENGLITITALTGEVTLTIPADVSEGFTWRCGRYDIELVASDDSVVRLVQGAVTVSKEITRV
jgi:hypothetical protein